MRKKTAGFAMTLLAIASIGIGTATAQRFTNPFSHLSSKFTDDDMRQMKAASAGLYSKDATPVKATVLWRNDKSGNSGIVTLLRRYTFKGLPCATMQHHFSIKGNLDPINLNFERCKTTSGEWKLR
jgi:surface antigen